MKEREFWSRVLYFIGFNLYKDMVDNRKKGIPEEWEEKRLGEVICYLSRWITPKYSENLGKNECYILNQRCIRDNNVSYNNSRFNNLEKRKVSIEKTLQELDILICSTGVWTLGRVAQIKNIPDKTTVDSHVTIVRAENCIDKVFLGFLLRWKESIIESLAEGSTWQTELPRKKLERLKILFPPLPEQKAIASLLSAFDDKIELLREENETLEEIGKSVFKEWFGKYKVGDELPEGWRVGKLGEIVELAYGRALKTEDRTNSWFPVYGSNGIVGYHKDYLVKGPGVIVWRKGTAGSITWCNENFFPIDTSFYVKDRLGVDSLYFHYFILKKYNLEKMWSDSAVPGLNRNSAYSIKIVIPNENILGEFSSLMKPIFEKIKINLEKIQTLLKTRDILLPKLMKWEVRVK